MYGIRDLVAVEATDLTVRLQLILITDQTLSRAIFYLERSLAMLQSAGASLASLCM